MADEPKKIIKETFPINKEAAVSYLENLQRKNSFRASVSLFGLIIVFLVALLFFLFPEKISTDFFISSDSESTLEKKILLIIEETSDLKQKIIESNSPKGDFDKFIELFYSGVSLGELKEKHSYNLKKLEALNKQIELIREKKLNGLKVDDTAKSIESIIATSITRAGSVLLTIFMMQILLGFYRYFIRLSNHYGEKLVAVVSINSNATEELRTIFGSLSTENINFGKDPTMPVDKIIDILKPRK